jgi:magnesium transporter
MLGTELRTYFRDVNDHLKLVDEEVVAQRDLLAVILQANMAVVSVAQQEISVSQNEITKQLTVIAMIFLPLTFITGFFGQNFGWLVGHITPFWAFAVYGIGSLVLGGALLYAWFRRRSYL